MNFSGFMGPWTSQVTSSIYAFTADSYVRTRGILCDDALVAYTRNADCFLVREKRQNAGG